MDDVVTKMKTGLQDANKEAIKSTNFTKLFSDYTDEYKKFKSFIGSDGIDVLDSKEALRSGEKIIKLFKQIQSNYGDLSNMDVNLAKKLFPSEFTGQAKKAQEAIDNYENAAQKISNLEINLQEQRIELERLRNAAEAAKDQLNAINYTPGDLEKLRTDSANAALEVEKLQKQLRQKLGLDENADLEEELAKIKKNREEYEKAQQAKKDYAKNYGDNKTINEIRKEKKELEELISLMKKRKELSESEKERFSELSKKTGITNQAEAGKKTKTLNAQMDYLSMADTSNIDIPDEEINKMSEELEKASIKSAQLKKSLEETGKEAIKFAKAQKDYGDKNAAYEKAKLSVEQLDQQLTDLKNSQGSITDLFNTFNQIFANPEKLAATADNLEKIKANLSNMDEATKNRIVENLQKMGLSAEQAEQQVDELRNSFRGMGDEAKEISKAEQEMENLKNQMLQFVGLTNSIYLFKRAVQSAINTVKELDAVMTETAVVTDFTIGDMWERLPEYAAEATKLGASIKDLYSATTLYYQQGLKTEAAMGVGIETMKMARIANMDATDATTAMTAALRGFNMEVNEMNATRVNDVYSELAAITAADTNQIATAMGKTASIAASANMEFETTAALLAQIIETTQEAPETAGTAMKTIIARFTEVKELFSEGMLTGEDEEGEEININKIDAALRSVGISLKDFLNGSKGIDDIFLELASKWDDLDLATQRYIATMAAGSRQQSRFIAMMSNYDRTMELVGAANNSAGASQEQFNKTLDSLDAKLQKLRNAWNEFTMGLANNELIKVGVDILTGALNIINSIIEALSGGNGLSKSVITLAIAISAVKGASALLNKFFNSSLLKTITKSFDQISQQAKTTGTEAGENIRSGIAAGLDSAGAEAYQKGVVIGSNLQQGINDGQSSQLSGQMAIEDFNTPQTPKTPAQDGQIVSNGIITSQSQPTVNPEQIANQSKLEQTMNSTSISGLRLTGTLTALAGAGLNWGASAIKAADETNAFGAGLEAAGTTASIAGSAVSMLAPVLSAAGVAIGPVLAVMAALVVVIGLLAAEAQKAYNASPEGKLKSAEKTLSNVTDAANEAANAYNNLSNSINEINNQQIELNQLTSGTKEWQDSIQNLNGEILNLLALYPKLGDYIDYDNGVLKFKNDIDSFMKEIKDIQTQTEVAKIEAETQVLQAQRNLRFSELPFEAVVFNSLGETFEEAVKNNPVMTREEVANFYKTRQIQTLGKEEIDQEGTEKLALDIVTGAYQKENYDTTQLELIRGAEYDIPIENTSGFLALKEFGEYLLASQNALDTFTQSLISTAVENSKINEQYQDNAYNFLNVDLVEQIKNQEEKDIDPTDETVKQLYANKMDYQYENGKFYSGHGENKKEIVVAEQDIKTQLAAINTTKILSDKMETLSIFIGILSQKTDAASAAFVGLTSEAEGQGLTTTDLKAFTREENGQIKIDEAALQDFYTKNEAQMSILYGGFDNFLSYASSSLEIAADQQIKTKQRLEILGQEELFEGFDINMGDMSMVTDQLYKAYIVSGERGIAGLTTAINEEMAKISNNPEQAKKFVEGLTMIDWSNIDSIEQLDEILMELGFDAELAGIDIESLEEQIASAAKATKTFNLDSLKEEIKSTEDLIDDIKDREHTERAFTKEQRDLIVSADKSLESQFVMTGIDEFTYVGDSISSLISALNDNTSALLGQYGDQVKYNADMSRKWEELKQTGSWSYGEGENKVEIGQNTYEVLASIATAGSTSAGASLISSGEGDPGKYNIESIRNVMAQLGIANEGALNSLSDIELTELITEHYNKYGSVAARTVNYQAETDYLDNEAYIKKVNALESGQGLIVEETNTEAYNQQKAAIDAVALSTEGAMGQYAKWSSEMKNFDKLSEKEKLQLQQLAIFSTKYANSVDDLAEALSDEIDVLKKGDKAGDKYQKALEKIAAKAQKVFGPKVNAEYVAANKDLFVQLAKGGKEGIKAFEKIAKDQRDAYIDKMGKLPEETQNALGTGTFDEVLQEILTSDQLELDVPIDIDKLTTQYGADLQTFLADPDVQTLLELSGIVVKDGQIVKVENGSEGFKINNTGSGSKSNWENPYDKFYNTLREINEELRKREQLERRYQKLIETRSGSANELFQLSQKELEQLKKEAELQEELKKGRQEQIAELVAKNEKRFGKYVQVSEGENGEPIIRIDWEEINKIKGTKKGEALEEYISKLEEWADSIEDANDTLDDIEDTVYEIEQRGREEYLELEERIKDALLQSYQTQIDKLTDINDTINDTNSRLLDAMQESIAEQRQARENEKTEEDLADKQRRLAYLRQDTSGANALEIMQLEKELDEGTESYTDQLIDQKINELQKQNDEAAEQRERQIEIAQNQLDAYVESGQIWTEVDDLMKSYLDPNNGPTGKLLELLQSEEGFKSLSRLGKDEWMSDLKIAVAQALSWVMGTNQLENIEGMEGKTITVTDKNGNVYTGTVDAEGNFTSDDGNVRFEDVYQGLDGNYHTAETLEEGQSNVEKFNQEQEEKFWKENEATNKYTRNGKEYIVSDIETELKRGSTGNEVRALQWALKKLGYRKNGTVKNFGAATETELKNFQAAEGIETTGILDYETRKKFRLKGYKTGGLADFTGPAWLDGTKAHPEYILNAEQTKSFFELVDVLSGLKSGINTNSQITGDSIYDVDINVESIGSDYDIEQLAQTVKRMINDDARYRNNNAINLSR